MGHKKGSGKKKKGNAPRRHVQKRKGKIAGYNNERGSFYTGRG